MRPDIKRWRLIPASANGRPALAGYLWEEQTEAFTPYCLYVLTLREGRIEEITAFVAPETLQRFGLPRVDRRTTIRIGGRARAAPCSERSARRIPGARPHMRTDT
jgi:hypothetical protein